MKIIIIGATGTIGKAVSKELAARHTIVSVGHQHGDVQMDVNDPKSIEAMYKKIGNVDAVVATTGEVRFKEMAEITTADYEFGLHSKLMGQVNLVLLGIPHLNDGGSFTLTSGILSLDPIIRGSSASMVNAAIDGFVIGAAIELPRGLRINAVSPNVITESMDKYAPYFRGFESVPAARAALAYSKSVEGAQTGQVYQVW